jgi:glycosyltransferase involved in cell wall biosynthesis
MICINAFVMRILFFIESLTAGGKERRLSQLMKGLRSSTAIDFSLAIMDKEIHYKEVYDLNIEIHYIIRKVKKDISAFFEFYKLCKRLQPDIVHCWDGMTAIYLVPTCKLLKIKIVNGMVVDTPVKQNILNKYWLRARLTFPFSNIIVGNSNAGLLAYKAPKRKSICINNGMDLSRFENLMDPSQVRLNIFGNITTKCFIAGMVGSFEGRKDYDTLIKAAVPLVSARSDIRFVIIGDGSDFNRIRACVPDYLLDKIVFLGKRSDVESIVNIFDIGILLTNAKVHGEGISNSIIEYMALGKPVIATQGGGTDEVVFDNKNGFLIEPGNQNMLTNKIELLIENPLLISKFGNEGKKMIKERFDLQIMTKNYAELYHKLLSR